jgi:hypothetical protein
MKSLVDIGDFATKKLKEELDSTQLEQRQKAALLERMEFQFKSEKRFLEAILISVRKTPRPS